MSGPFFGRSENAVHNNRVMIPAQFKRKFADESLRTVVVTCGPRDSIALYPLDSWYETLAELLAGNDDDRKFRAELIDCAVTEAELEGPGRIRLPEQQLREAGITDKAIVKGEGHFISIWNPDSYYSKYAKDREHSRQAYDTYNFQPKPPK